MRRASTRAPPVTYTEPPSNIDADEVSLSGVVGSLKKTRAKKRKVVHENEDGKEVVLTKSPRRRRGLLKDLVEMPIDILFEIFAQLDPLDLVYISRTTKAFRSMLMHRSSKPIWHSARSHIEDLPNCPDDLSEPQYAVLLFSKYCSFCLQNKTTYLSWSARVRTCNKCLENHFQQCRSYTYNSPRGYPSILAQWLPLLNVVRLRGRKKEEGWFIYLEQDRQWKKAYNSAISPDMKVEWVEKQLNKQYAIEEHARECELWHMKYYSSDDGSIQKKLEIACNKIQIKEYIKELGYEEELYKIPPAIRPHPLNEQYIENALRWRFSRESLEKLKTQLTNRMEGLKSKRMESWLAQIFQSRKQFLTELRIHGYRELLKNTPLLSLSDIHEVAEKHDFIDYSKPPDNALSVPFSVIVNLWKSSIDTQLVALIKAACGSQYDYDDNKVLSLATTAFRCKAYVSCCHGKIMRHNRAAVHICDVGIREVFGKRDRALVEAFGTTSRFSTRVQSVLEYSKDYQETAAEVVRLAGLDPVTATASEMDGLNLIFECLVCNDIDEGRATMTWDAVCVHKYNVHGKYTNKSMELQVLTGIDAKAARKRILEEQIHKAHNGSIELTCIHCLEVMPKIKAYRDHLRVKHAVTDIVKYEDLVFSEDADRTPDMFRLWPPFCAVSQGTKYWPESDSSCESDNGL